MKTIDRFLRAQQGQLAYHGTTAESGRAIEQEGVLRPRGEDPSNWGGSSFLPHMPSNPDWAYVSTDKTSAEVYMRDILQRSGDPEQGGAIVTVEIDPGSAHPDEDTIAAFMFWDKSMMPERVHSLMAPLSEALWTIYAEMEGEPERWDEFREYSIGAISDDEMMAISKMIAEVARTRLPPEQFNAMMQLNSYMAFDNPLPVVSVEYFE